LGDGLFIEISVFILIFDLNSKNFSDELYAWLTVFVLPINSAVNPLIYTVMTPSFKRRISERRRSQVAAQLNADAARQPWYSLLYCACLRRLSKYRSRASVTAQVV